MLSHSEETGPHYDRLFEKGLAASVRTIAEGEEIPEHLYRHLTPNALTTIDLEWDRAGSQWTEPGFYHEMPLTSLIW